ncbi:phage baseplate upper protein [Enterococcus avium]|uniref:phage baseplate upper protein n=1 Tax=Enterococcus avium TaxID=33945 RepID=UPI0028920158|nr:phage baseplate upper protein [Enterococcus avium]MDT2461466.1 phage baseplate upper protein [Enterococcus avium]
MAKWNVALSTTEPYNYVGMIQVRQGNKNSETMEATISQNGIPVDLSRCKAYLEAILSNGFAIQRAVKIIDAKNGKIQYTFDEYSMQALHRQTANFVFYQGEDVIATTQDFSYFVIKAVSKTEGEMGSYWQTVEDLIADMVAFINENKGDFTAWMNARKKEFEAWRDAQKEDYLTWFNSIKDILAQIDPGGTMLLELMEARVDIQGVRHESISKRLLADMEYLYQKLRATLFTIEYGEIEVTDILQDDLFSENHEVEKIGTVNYPIEEGALVIATVDDPKQNVFTLEKVGVV